MQKENNLLLDLIVVILGLIILLFGMNVVSSFTTSVNATYINIIPMCLALLFIIKSLHFNLIVGSQTIALFFVFVILLTLINIFYGVNFVYDDFLRIGGTLCTHPEHAWVYDNVLAISKVPLKDLLNGELNEMYLGKYQNLLFYLSFMIRFGGNIPTNICIWNAFHLSLSSILIAMSAQKMGIDNRNRLIFVFFVCLFQPILDSLTSFHRDGFGESFLIIGLYVFACTYKNNTMKIFAFLLYAFLFWCFRAQYIFVAIALLIWAIYYGKKRFSIDLVGVFSFFAIFLFVINLSEIFDFASDNLYFNAYEEAGERQGRSLINIILVGIIGYFPWTNLFRDSCWYYHVFACFQGAMDVVILYYVAGSLKNNLRAIFYNPILMVALLLFISALYLPGHTAYTMVSMPLFAVVISDTKFKNFISSYVYVCFIILLVGLVYGTLGFSGNTVSV